MGKSNDGVSLEELSSLTVPVGMCNVCVIVQVEKILKKL